MSVAEGGLKWRSPGHNSTLAQHYGLKPMNYIKAVLCNTFGQSQANYLIG